MGKLPFLRQHRWRVQLHTRRVRSALPRSSYTHGIVREGAPEYTLFSNEAGGPNYGPVPSKGYSPYTPKAPAYEPSTAFAPSEHPAYTPSYGGVPAVQGPSRAPRRDAPAVPSGRYVYNRSKRYAQHARDDIREAGSVAARYARRKREELRPKVEKFISEQKEHARQRAKNFIRDQREHAGGRVKNFIRDQAKHAAKRAAWTYAKLRAGAGVAKRAVQHTARVRAGGVNRAVRGFSRRHVINPVYQASRAVSAARGWVSRHR